MLVRGLVILFSLILLSCRMGPDYSRPGIDSPAAFRMATTAADALLSQICLGGNCFGTKNYNV